MVRKLWNVAVYIWIRFGYMCHRFLGWSPRCIRVYPAKRLKIRFKYFVNVETAERLVHGGSAKFRGPGTIVIQYTRRYLRPIVYARDGYCCVYCGRWDEQLTLDHVIPRAKGGLTVPHNLVTACDPCNQAKGDRAADEFISSRRNNHMADKQRIHPIIILERYVDLGVEKEERIPAFLTSDNHAMYVDRKTGSLLCVGVNPTNEHSVYKANEKAMFTELGRLEDSAQDTEIIEQLSTALHSMTAYEFVTKVILHVEQDVDYAGLIVPNLIQGAK